jgi:hypothetical protein
MPDGTNDAMGNCCPVQPEVATNRRIRVRRGLPPRSTAHSSIGYPLFLTLVRVRFLLQAASDWYRDDEHHVGLRRC